MKTGKCKELKNDCESSLRSLEKIRPSCLLSCLLSSIKDASFEGMKHLKIITFRQSSDAEPLLRKHSEDSVPERNQCICVLESGYEKSKRILLLPLSSSEVADKMRNCSLGRHSRLCANQRDVLRSSQFCANASFGVNLLGNRLGRLSPRKQDLPLKLCY